MMINKNESLNRATIEPKNKPTTFRPQRATQFHRFRDRQSYKKMWKSNWNQYKVKGKFKNVNSKIKL